MGKALRVVALFLILCACFRPDAGRAGGEVAGETSGEAVEAPAVLGLQFGLGEASRETVRVKPPPVAPAIPLAPAEVERVLKRLPPFRKEAQPREFALPEGPLPPPRRGAAVKQPFPPPGKPPTGPPQAPGPLEVVRYQPEGEVPRAPQLSVTFSRPMVALTSQAEASRTVPVQLEPQVPGTWRWIGSRTALFEPEGGQFPMATAFTATIPAGTTSATGETLDHAVRFSFSTPPPRLTASYPSSSAGPQVRNPLMFAAFDQRIHPEEVVKTIRLKAGGEVYRVHRAAAEEVAAHRHIRRLAEGGEKGRWLAFQADSPLPGDAEVVVEIGPGTPSAEGPRTTERVQSFSFRTYGPLEVRGCNCDDYSTGIPPLHPWVIRFSNPLDEESLRPSRVRVEPELPGLQLEASGDELWVRGRSRGRTTYTITLDGSIRDRFGQALGSEERVLCRVGSAPPDLYAPGGPMVVLDPAGPPALPVYTINYSRLDVWMSRVEPSEWDRFVTFWRSPQRPFPWRGKPRILKVPSRPDELVETRIDLSPVLKDGRGQAVVMVQPSPQPRERWRRRRVVAWVQATDLGLEAYSDRERLVARVTSLSSGKPLSGVEVELLPGGSRAVSGGDGLARLELPGAPGASLVVARRGSDQAILPRRLHSPGGWRKQPETDALRWYVVDDRKMYRPGEEARVKGWIRRIGAGPKGDVEALGSAVEAVSYQLFDSRGKPVDRGWVRLNPLGGFDFALKLPEEMNLGPALLKLRAEGGDPRLGGRETQHPLQVQEFRRPEFEVRAQSPEGPHFVGGSATVTVTASYYAGGGLPNAPVAWRVTASPARFTPPGWSGFLFGRWRPWWMESPSEVPVSRTENFQGITDGAGRHTLRMDFRSVEPPQPSTVVAEATVEDVNRQAWRASQSLLVHPADLYVGLRPRRNFVQAGEPFRLEAVVVDLDGRPVAGRPVVLRAARLEWRRVKGEWREVERDIRKEGFTSKAEPVSLEVPTGEGGTYRLSAELTDEKGRRNITEIRFWVAGGRRPRAARVEREEVRLIPDREEYRPGDVAEILVQAPFAPAEGILTLRRSGLLHTETFSIEGPTHTLHIPIREAHVPNLHVQVDLVGVAPRGSEALDGGRKGTRGKGKRPAYASGELNLSVPPYDRTLSLEVHPREKALEPGGRTEIGVELRDARGQPVAGGEVLVAVVDEAILALSGYSFPDPLSRFYSHRPEGVSDFHSRQYLLLARPPEPLEGPGEEKRSRAGGLVSMEPSELLGPASAAIATEERGGAAGAAAPIRVRTDFDPRALFEPAVRTGPDGRAVVEVKVPDNLTRYRVMAVAVAGGKQFGSAESTLTARLPLMVRPSAPRFLNFGDRFELPVVVQNQTDAPMTVEVAVRAHNLAFLPTRPSAEGPGEASPPPSPRAGRRVEVPPQDRVEVRLPATPVSAGKAAFQVAAVSERWADAAEGEFPVWTPATTEAFALYGTLEEGSLVQPVKPPPGAFPQFGGLTVTTSSTALQALTDAVLYLVSYPFECSEQLSSRILAVAALRDTLSAFKAEGLPPPREIEAAILRDIKRLQGMQNADGGFGLWRRGEESWPYVSIHAAHALARARQKGFEVPSPLLNRAREYLRRVESHIPSWYSPRTRRTIIAYALSVRHLLGERDARRAGALLREAGLEGLPLEALGWLLPVVADQEKPAIRRFLMNRVTETAGTAHFVTRYAQDEGYLVLASDRRTDGILLEALIRDSAHPAWSDLLPKIVRGLLAHRKKGHWGNTQENAFVLLALDRYFNTYEKTPPDFVARLWLGKGFAGEQRFRGRSTDYRVLEVPMRYLSAHPGDLALSKEGPGRLYYRLGLRYAPRDLDLDPADHGFTVQREYQAVDDPEDVRRGSDGVWRIRAGARVRVRLAMVAPTRRYHVALVDPLPAGFEPLNPALAVTGTIPRDPSEQRTRGRWWWWILPWYEHQNMRDERIEAFSSLVWEGVHRYSYVARATTPGEFLVPPARAEEMYHPETFGRSATDHVVIR